MLVESRARFWAAGLPRLRQMRRSAAGQLRAQTSNETQDQRLRKHSEFAIAWLDAFESIVSLCMAKAKLVWKNFDDLPNLRQLSWKCM